MKRKSFLNTILIFFFYLGLCSVSIKAAAEDLPQDLSTVGLDTLLNMDLVVKLPGKKDQKASEAGSAIYVISQDDIRRSGATHVAELLRLVPGVDVARISADRWAISVRGFNQAYSNKLLVLIDGVSVFSPTTNGVYWESNELVLEDIDRIEVVRGPGGVLWGSNAVNGVINIVTKNANDTKGLLATVGGGTFEKTFTTLRYGGELDPSTPYRVYGTFHNRGENEAVAGGGAQDDWQSSAGGFRVDSQATHKDLVTLTGDYQYQSDDFLAVVPSLTAPTFVDDKKFLGASSSRSIRTVADWTHSVSADSDLNAKISFSQKDRNTKVVSFNYNIINTELEHRWKLNDTHELVYGGGYRYFVNDTDDTMGQRLSPDHRTTNLFNTFLQDDISIVPDRLHFILGGKFEHHQSTGLEYMPNGRIVYTPTKQMTIWSSISRAVAPPAIFFEDSTLPVSAFPLGNGSPPGVATLYGSRDLGSENLLAYELGLRQKVSKTMSFDVAGFYNQYSDIFSGEQQSPTVGTPFGNNQPAVVFPLVFDNQLSGRSIGGEVALEWQPHSSTKFTTFYSFQDTEIDTSHSNDIADKNLFEGGSPENQAGLRAHLALSDTVSSDTFLRYVDHLNYNDIPAYVDLDTRLAWQISKCTEISIVGTNLLHTSHEEFQSNLLGPPATAIQRAVYGMIRVNF